ncbi:uncharacterized protein PAC_03343 [Phialocephala subalpina]|uniref:SAP domain-containing protein n=1 Tax=Phialocephala subalpina TaxID=576137 RepID=A0A1L7WKZ9_9HELO|nr:uncharacterized protein PAC_03343 [Phialocephala subalpina]
MKFNQYELAGMLCERDLCESGSKESKIARLQEDDETPAYMKYVPYEEVYKTFTRDKLRELLRERALPYSGNKAVQIARLLESDKEVQSDDITLMEGLAEGLVDLGFPTPRFQTSVSSGLSSPSTMSQPPSILEPNSSSADGATGMDSLFRSRAPMHEISNSQGPALPVGDSAPSASKPESPSSSTEEEDIRCTLYDVW